MRKCLQDSAKGINFGFRKRGIKRPIQMGVASRSLTFKNTKL